MGFLGGSVVKNLPAVQETQEKQKTQVQSLGWEDPLEKGMETYSSIPTQETQGTEPCGLQSTGLH